MCKLINKVKKFFINNRPEAWMGAMYYRDEGYVEDWSHKIEVSTLGNVRYTESYRATNKNIRPCPQIVSAGSVRGKYKYVRFPGDEGKDVQRRLHRMVLSTFRPLPNTNTEKMDGDHIDFNQTNNKLSNLQWMERKAHQKRRRA